LHLLTPNLRRGQERTLHGAPCDRVRQEGVGIAACTVSLLIPLCSVTGPAEGSQLKGVLQSDASVLRSRRWFKGCKIWTALCLKKFCALLTLLLVAVSPGVGDAMCLPFSSCATFSSNIRCIFPFVLYYILAACHFPSDHGYALKAVSQFLPSILEGRNPLRPRPPVSARPNQSFMIPYSK